MNEPTTETGKRLLAAEHARIADAVRRLPCCSFRPGGRRKRHDDGCWGPALRAVLAIINQEETER